MNSIAFLPIIDFPLIGVLLAGFMVNSWLWAKSENETGVDLLSRLPGALIRIFLFFLGLLLFCWFFNIGVWAVAAALIVAGVVVTIFAGGHNFAPEMIFVATAEMLREWAFGFPNLILSAPTRSPARPSQESHELVGTLGMTTSELRPIGEIKINSNEHTAISDSGTFIEAGTEVVVVAVKDGRARVKVANQDQTTLSPT